MRKLMNDHAVLVLVTAGLAIAVIAAPTLAGTVYSWTTEDGSAAYTDDPKRIPAKYKKTVESRQLGKLKNYKQYSESQVKFETPYEKRIGERLQSLRAIRTPDVSAPPPGFAGGVRYGVGLGARDNDQVSFPVDGASSEPFVTSDHRINTRDSIATQDVQITKQGDRVISVRISAPNQRKVTEYVTGDVLDALARGRAIR